VKRYGNKMAIYKPGEFWNRSCPHSLSEVTNRAHFGSTYTKIRSNQPGQHLEFRLTASKHVKQYISVLWPTQFVVLCFRSPSKLIQGLNVGIRSLGPLWTLIQMPDKLISPEYQMSEWSWSPGQ